MPKKHGVLAVVLVVLAELPAQAQIANGGFETGSFAGWTTVGNATTIGALVGAPGPSVPPDAGSFQAYLQTQTGVLVGPLETFLGAGTGAISALDGASGPAMQGSAIKQTVTVTAGHELKVRFNFLTTETPMPNTLQNDLAFVAIVGPGGKVVRIANTQSGFTPGPVPYNPSTNPGDGMTSYRTFTHRFTASGTVTIAIGVVDMGDTLHPSAVLIDSITIGPGSSGEGTYGGARGLGGAKEPLDSEARPL